MLESDSHPTATLVETSDVGSPRPPTPPLDLRGRHVGRYLVLSTLGRGGMGVVVEAHDPVLDRSVALKLLGAAVRRSDVRLLREAQALARLSHPNVIQVYDVGEIEGQAFIAMELVRGRTLRVWGRERQSWRTAVAVYLQAARGLAAAHLKGLVHRDFKPENCIIDDEGRVRVLDFGLAREIAAPNPTPAPSEPEESDAPGELDAPDAPEEPHEPLLDDEPSHVLAKSLTRPGTLMGTLGYLAFEQLQGRQADALSDQYAFCVSLYEAILGVPPYIGHNASTLYAAMFGGHHEPVPSGVLVPRRLSRALWRGLSPDPASRWPSMQALIDELVALSSARRWRTVAATLGVGLALAGGLALVREPPDPCPSVETALAGTWDAEARHRVEEAFASHTLTDGELLLPRVVERLDGYAAAWAGMTHESCRATFVVRRQSEAQLEQRTRCLERRRNRLVATIAALADARSADELTQAVVLPFRLPALDPCAEAQLAEPDPTPSDRALDVRHIALRRNIDEANTQREAGRLEEATRLAQSTLVEARTLHDPALLAEALEGLGRTQTEAGLLETAQGILEQAVVAASDAEDDATVARAWSSLVFVATMRGNHAEAEHHALAARAAVERADDDVLRAWLLNNLGILAAERGSLTQAREQLEQALALKQAALGAGHVDVGIAWLNLGTMLSNGNEPQGAADALSRARDIFALTVGTGHPLTALALSSQCHAEHGLHHEEAAIELCEQALTRFGVTRPEPYRESNTRFTLAEALWSMGRRDEALTMARQALALVESVDPRRAAVIAAGIKGWAETHGEGKQSSP